MQVFSEQTLLNGTKCSNQREEVETSSLSSCLYYFDLTSRHLPACWRKQQQYCDMKIWKAPIRQYLNKHSIWGF